MLVVSDSQFWGCKWYPTESAHNPARDAGASSSGITITKMAQADRANSCLLLLREGLPRFVDLPDALLASSPSERIAQGGHSDQVLDGRVSVATAHLLCTHLCPPCPMRRHRVLALQRWRLAEATSSHSALDIRPCRLQSLSACAARGSRGTISSTWLSAWVPSTRSSTATCDRSAGTCSWPYLITVEATTQSSSSNRMRTAGGQNSLISTADECSTDPTIRGAI